MRITRVDHAIERCQEHLNNTGAFGTEIENLLTQSLLVLICSEFEQKIERLIQDRCSHIPDEALKEFVGSCVGAVFRSVKSSEISGLLNRFGGEYKERFKDRVDANPRTVTYWNNIVINRHGIAHAEGTNTTFNDAKLFYENGHEVLDWVKDTLA